MKPLSAFLLLLLTINCSDNPVDRVTQKKAFGDTIKQDDPKSLTEQTTQLNPDTPRFDTKTLRRKGAKLLADLKESNDYAIRFGKDTLIDLNGDGNSDLLIEYYKAAGTGLKNAVDIYPYNNKSNRFLTKPIELPNPTFDFTNNTVVSYYVGCGGGYATELRWRGLKLDTIESIDVENDQRNDIFTSTAIVHNHLTGAEKKKVSDMVWLPGRYKYFNYQPIIRRELE
jgi:hypothetical protein